MPAGQAATRISLNSISSANENASCGNFVDAVSVTSGACVVTSNSVTSLSGDGDVRLGDTLQYSIIATNHGASDASLASITDNLPVDSIAALPSVDNTATVSYTDALSTMSRVSTSNTTTTPITSDAPLLSIVTSGTVTPAEGQDATALDHTIVWSYVVSNTGDVPVTDVTVIDPEGGTITCSPTTLTAGEDATCTGTATHEVTQADLAVGSVSNGATAQATSPFGAPLVDSAESVATIITVALAPEIAVTVSHDNLSEVEAGSPIVAENQLRARFIVTNTGNATLGTLVVGDPIFGAVTCDEMTLEPGESTNCVADELYTVTVTVTVTVTDADADADARTISRTISASGVADMGAATSAVVDEQLVTLDVAIDLPTLPLPEPVPFDPEPNSPESDGPSRLTPN